MKSLKSPCQINNACNNEDRKVRVSSENGVFRLRYDGTDSDEFYIHESEDPEVAIRFNKYILDKNLENSSDTEWHGRCFKEALNDSMAEEFPNPEDVYENRMTAFDSEEDCNEGFISVPGGSYAYPELVDGTKERFPEDISDTVTEHVMTRIGEYLSREQIAESVEPEDMGIQVEDEDPKEYFELSLDPRDVPKVNPTDAQ